MRNGGQVTFFEKIPPDETVKLVFHLSQVTTFVGLGMKSRISTTCPIPNRLVGCPRRRSTLMTRS
jgi:hypothetical protein